MLRIAFDQVNLLKSNTLFKGRFPVMPCLLSSVRFLTFAFVVLLTAAHADEMPEAWEGYRFVDSDEIRALDLSSLAFAE